MTEVEALFLEEGRLGRISPYPVWRDGLVTRTEVPGIAWFVSAEGLTEANVDDVIWGEIEHFKSLGLPFEWTPSNLDPPFLKDRLVAAGFIVGPREVTVYFDLDTEIPQPQHTVREVSDEEGLADFRKVASVVFGKDFGPSTGALRSELEVGTRTHLAVVAYDGTGKPVSTGRLLKHPEGLFAGLYSGSTITAYRHQGFYQSVVLARMKIAQEMGAKYAMVDAMATSLPHLLKMGFEPLCESYPCEWNP